jgi:hypothetical protein
MTPVPSGRARTVGTGADRDNDVPSIVSTEGRGRPAWRLALALTLLLRLTYSLFAAIASLFQSVNWRLVHSNALTENLPPPDHSLRYLLFGVWERFDTLWYSHIAAYGYDRPEAVVFFPLYPGLIRIVSLLLPPTAAALLIATVAAFFLFWGLQELLLADQPPNLVNQSVLVCAVWPASFIFFAGYAESLLFALIVWSLIMARRERWLWALTLGMAAALTKAVGAAVAVPLLIMALRQNQKLKAIPLLLIPLGSAAFLQYLHWTVHSTFASAYTQYWRTSTAPPWTTLWVSVRTLAHTPNPILVLNVIFLLSIFILVTRSRLRMEYLLYSAAAIVIFLCKETTPPLQSVMRYLLIIFPAYVGFARIVQGPRAQPRFGMVCAALFVINLGLLWLFLGWSLVL